MKKLIPFALCVTLVCVYTVVLCSGCHSVDTRTDPQGGKYIEDRLENGLMWMFEKGLAMHFSKYPLEALETLPSHGVPNFDVLSTEESSRLRKDYEDIEKLILKEAEVGLYGYGWDPSMNGQDEYFLSFRLSGYGAMRKRHKEENWVHYEVRCYLRDIHDTVIEYWVVETMRNTLYTWEDSYADDTQLFFITIADTITAPRRVAIRSDQFVESAVVGGRTVQFPKDNLNALYKLAACAFPMSYLNSDLDGYMVVVKWKEKKNGSLYAIGISLKKVGKIKRFFYSWNTYGRGYIGKSRIVKR